MRRLLDSLVAMCLFLVLAVAASLMPVTNASAEEVAPSPAGSSPAAGSTSSPDQASTDQPSTDQPSADQVPDGDSGQTGAPATGVTRTPVGSDAEPLAPLAGETTPTPSVTLSPPVTTITSTPPARSTTPRATFRFAANQAGVTFQCKLTGPGQTGVFSPCTVQPAPGDTTVPATGSTTYSGLKAGNYTFTVHATPTVPAGAAPGPDATPFEWRVDDCTSLAELCPVFAPASYSVPAGARFNNPLSDRPAQLRNLNHVIETVKSMPGYQVADPSLCPRDAASAPSAIRISLYSVTNIRFANAMVAAHRRCVSVQILMNNHLSAETSDAIALMQEAMGTSIRTTVDGATVDKRSFARRCSYGCRGTGVLHSKFYLFDSRLAVPGRARISDVTMVGSSNMTGNASGVQWNDLYTVKGHTFLHDNYLAMFNRMKVDQTDLHTVRFSHGAYSTTFWPQTPDTADPTMSVLNSIRCTGATGGAGINGRTVVYINIHAWFEARGLRLAQRVRQMYNRGCYVRILYSFMSRTVYDALTVGTGSRMVARRTLFSLDGDRYADVYSHFKMIAASGVIGTDTSAWAVWTGSMNFTNDGTHFDEVMQRISVRSAFAAYRDRWSFIRDRKSSPVWATFLEPIGGGRPPAALTPETKALRETTSFAVQSREVILAPDAIAGTAADPRALD
jgi:hypothetical protein